MNIIVTPRTRTAADLVPSPIESSQVDSTRYERQVAGASRIIMLLVSARRLWRKISRDLVRPDLSIVPSAIEAPLVAINGLLKRPPAPLTTSCSRRNTNRALRGKNGIESSRHNTVEFRQALGRNVGSTLTDSVLDWFCMNCRSLRVGHRWLECPYKPNFIFQTSRVVLSAVIRRSSVFSICHSMYSEEGPCRKNRQSRKFFLLHFIISSWHNAHSRSSMYGVIYIYIHTVEFTCRIIPELFQTVF